MPPSLGDVFRQAGQVFFPKLAMIRSWSVQWRIDQQEPPMFQQSRSLLHRFQDDAAFFFVDPQETPAAKMMAHPKPLG